MSRLTPRLARRIDRLARRAHAFHRAAHHPLCGAYERELLRLGRRTRICRGCSSAAAGCLAGLLAGLLSPPAKPATMAAAAALFATVSFAVLAAPARPKRTPKLLTRFVPAALGGAIVSAGFVGLRPLGACWATAVIATALLAIRAYRHRGPDRSPCAACPDRAGARACPGFRPIARREAAFRRLAGRWIRASARP